MSLALREFTPAECYAVLEEERFGHLACCKDGQPYVVPIYFSYQNGVAYCFSMPGRKLEWMRENDKICLQVDRRVGKGWTSVIVEGRFEEFPDTAPWRSERLHAWEMLQKHPDWWEVGSLKPHEVPALAESPHIFFGILVRTVSGRAAFAID
ncbi:pyridoxamine 5'-phosphate oxidase family protein [Rhizobium lentis]|uniref:pyridoxamine 5'-phosphate oxidase family protein n=1 Tax=Rhizobium lentis TaxID=1138194 RepID=UPI001C839FC9|nr:pyridoxamine 5'-phosphate oxidase family protein [Rhizobium lentis]MBX5148037.1 pyridoxamine 5'-phosphate oxidase family protein [Rhizobium lentis]